MRRSNWRHHWRTHGLESENPAIPRLIAQPSQGIIGEPVPLGLEVQGPTEGAVGVGNNDRQPIREKISSATSEAAARLNTQPGKAGSVPAGSPSPSDLERQASEEQRAAPTADQSRQTSFGPWELRSDQWELGYEDG